VGNVDCCRYELLSSIIYQAGIALFRLGELTKAKYYFERVIAATALSTSTKKDADIAAAARCNMALIFLELGAPKEVIIGHAREGFDSIAATFPKDSSEVCMTILQ
jgi:hypothetical protein